MESLSFLNISFAWLPGGISTAPGEFNFFYISQLKSLNLVLIPGTNLNGRRGPWAGCSYWMMIINIKFSHEENF